MTKRPAKKIIALGALFLFWHQAAAVAAGLGAAEIKITPVASASAGGGQYFYGGSVSNGASADVYLCPVVNFSRDTALLPMYFGSYRGTKDVRELVGGGTLTQENQNHSIALKYVTKAAADIRIRARAGYKIEYVKETKDEVWGKGLFDYNRVIAGLEAEKSFDKSSVRAGVDYYTMKYPNYRSLLSQSEFETSLDTTTYTELSTNAGKDVLDNANVVLAAQYRRAVDGDSYYEISSDVALKNFSDQKVVSSDGSFSKTLRSDVAASAGAAYVGAFPRVRATLGDTVRLYTSNQNSFDAGAAKYIEKYYNYIENSFAPSVAFYLGGNGKRAVLNFYVEFANRFYSDRPAQNQTGAYLSEKTWQSTQTAGFSLSYPVYKSLSARLSSSYRTTASNMKFEGNYKYNYDVYTYFAGVNWEL